MQGLVVDFSRRIEHLEANCKEPVESEEECESSTSEIDEDIEEEFELINEKVDVQSVYKSHMIEASTCESNMSDESALRSINVSFADSESARNRQAMVSVANTSSVETQMVVNGQTNKQNMSASKENQLFRPSNVTGISNSQRAAVPRKPTTANKQVAAVLHMPTGAKKRKPQDKNDERWSKKKKPSKN